MSSPTKNLGLVFTKVPMHFPLANEHVTVQDTGPFDLDQPLPSEDGSSGLILQTLYASLDPYLRGLLRDPAVKSYMPALPLGSPISAYTLSRVLRSNIPGYEEGDIVRLTLPIRQYNLFIYKPSPGQMKPFKVPDPNDPKLDMVHYLGALGMPGLTAYSSLYEIGKPQKGEIIVVSSAAGAVGQLVGQLAKHEGLTVLGSVGSDDKLKFIIEELGFDGGWNYKHEKSTKEAIERLVNEQTQKKGEKIPEEKVNGVGGIDIFYDNVGGEQLEGAIESLNLFGRYVFLFPPNPPFRPASPSPSPSLLATH